MIDWPCQHSMEMIMKERYFILKYVIKQQKRNQVSKGDDNLNIVKYGRVIQTAGA